MPLPVKIIRVIQDGGKLFVSVTKLVTLSFYSVCNIQYEDESFYTSINIIWIGFSTMW